MSTIAEEYNFLAEPTDRLWKKEVKILSEKKWNPDLWKPLGIKPIELSPEECLSLSYPPKKNSFKGVEKMYELPNCEGARELIAYLKAQIKKCDELEYINEGTRIGDEYLERVAVYSEILRKIKIV